MLYRVSDVLSIYKDFSGIDPQVLEEKAQIGTNVHACIEAFYSGVFFPPEGREVGYFNSFIKWNEKNSKKPSISEKRYQGNGRYKELSGQIDALIEINGKPILLDFKCSSSPDFLCWSLQAYYYQQILLENDIFINENCLFLKLDKDGKMPREYWLHIDDQIKQIGESTWDVFKVKNGLTKLNKKGEKNE